jgi:DNA modification methylase/endonuclease YncB( thermonuclease family)
MVEIADNTMDCIITSPPYWQLKDYGNEEQIGFHDSYESYINHLNLVWQESYRVLDTGCRLCINIGDQFARAVYYGRYKVIPIRTEIIKFCETIGFDYMGAIIWQKKTTTNTTGGASVMGSFPYPKNGILSIDYEFILIFKKPGIPKKPVQAFKEGSKLTKEEWKEYFSGHWNFGGVKQKHHIAMFPEELPARLIKMFSFIGDTILDPFLGSGTTALAARNLDRNSVGYEINPAFMTIIRRKLHTQRIDLLNARYNYVVQKDHTCDVKQRINNLPYKFKDHHAFDKKIDPKKLQFGSKIDHHSKSPELYFRVRDIIAPEILLLNNGLKIRLLGIHVNEPQKGAARDFISKKVHNQKVFLKFDDIKYDAENNLFCYLYLKNKTFINAHLIKNGYATADRHVNYKYKSRFIALEKTNNKTGERN